MQFGSPVSQMYEYICHIPHTFKLAKLALALLYGANQEELPLLKLAPLRFPSTDLIAFGMLGDSRLQIPGHALRLLIGCCTFE